MPFIAFDPEREERIEIFRYRWPKEELAGRRLVCPYCEVEMIIRHGEVYLPHFAHRQHCPYEDWHHSETPEHEAVKDTLCAWLRQDPFWREADIDTEQKIPQARRVPDVLVVFPDGTRVAHECQLSPMTEERFWERSDDYKEAGVTAFWWFSKWYLDRKWNLRNAVGAHQSVELTIILKKGPNPYRDDPDHRQYHIWPEKVFLWAEHRYLPEPKRRCLISAEVLAPCSGSSESVAASTDRRIHLLEWSPLPVELQRVVWLPVLWNPVYRVLKEAEGWLDQNEMHRPLAPGVAGAFHGEGCG